MPFGGPWQNVECVYHFTDRENLTSIQAHGGLWSLAQLKVKGIKVPRPGGNEWSHDADAIKGMDTYVHLCFTDEHPMEYRAKQEGHINDPVYIEILPEVLRLPQVCFSSDVSNKSGVVIHPIASATNMIDFEVLYTRTDWRDPAIQERLKQARKYEVLIPDHVPLNLMRLPNG